MEIRILQWEKVSFQFTMVRTRSSARGHLYGSLSQELRYMQEDLERETYQSDRSFGFSQHSQHSQHSDNNNGQPQYKEQDNCHRHRKADDSPYTVEVSSYKRRK